MIFDQEAVKALVIQYQHSKDVDVLSSIVEQTESLIEAIVSSYDNEYRDDLIQESFLRIQYAIKYYKPIYSLHNYFTTVIRNACCTYLKKQSKYVNMYEGDDETCSELACTDTGSDFVLINLQFRNKERFAELDGAAIDVITYELYHSIINDSKTCRKLISNLAVELNINRSRIQAIYNSTVMYIRNMYITEAPPPDSIHEDIDIDLIEFVGESIYIKLKILLHGLAIKL